MDIYYYVLRVTNSIAMATMTILYMGNFVNKLKKKWRKKDILSPISTTLITDKQICHVYVGLQLY